MDKNIQPSELDICIYLMKLLKFNYFLPLSLLLCLTKIRCITKKKCGLLGVLTHWDVFDGDSCLNIVLF